MESMIAEALAAPSGPLQTGEAEGATTPVAETQVAAPAEAEEAKPEEEFSLNLDEDPEAEAKPGSPEETKPSEQSAEGELDADSEVGKLLATSRGRRIYAEFKKSQQLAKLPEEGGIGHNPSPEQVRGYYEAFTDKQLMEHEFDSGDSAREENFVNYWFGRDESGAARPGAVRMAAVMMDTLTKVNPQAYAAAARPAISRFIDGMYRASAVQSDPEVRESMLRAAQIGEWWITGGPQGGKFRDQPDSNAAPQANNNAPNPDRIELERLKSQMAADRSRATQQQRQTVEARVDTEVDRALRHDAGKALAAIKGRVDDFVYDSLLDRLIKEVNSDVERNRDGMQLFQIQKERAVQTGSEQAIKDLVRLKRQMAAQAIIAKRERFINSATASLKQQNDARHAQLQRSGSMVEPNGQAAPVRRDIGEALTRRPDETHEAFLMRTIQHATRS